MLPFRHVDVGLILPLYMYPVHPCILNACFDVLCDDNTKINEPPPIFVIPLGYRKDIQVYFLAL